MTATKKSEEAGAAVKPDIVESAVTLYTKGVERLAEVQKKSVDLATLQNAELIGSWKKLADMVPAASGFFMLDLANNALEQLANTQKGAIDVVVEQSHALAALVKERTAEAAKANDGAVLFVQEMVDRSVSTQKKALDNAAAQTKAALETAKKQFGLAGTPAEAAADSFQRGVNTLVSTQKELLDVAAKPFHPVH